MSPKFLYSQFEIDAYIHGIKQLKIENKREQKKRQEQEEKKQKRITNYLKE